MRIACVSIETQSGSDLAEILITIGLKLAEESVMVFFCRKVFKLKPPINFERRTDSEVKSRKKRYSSLPDLVEVFRFIPGRFIPETIKAQEVEARDKNGKCAG